MVDIYGDNGDNSLVGRSEDSGAHHNVFGLDGNDRIASSTGSDNYFGGNGDDYITGVNGSRYNDQLTGGAGADTFEIRGSYSSGFSNSDPVNSANAVQILDYSSEDTIILGDFESNNVDDFYTVHYGSSTSIHDGGSGEIVASIAGDSYELPPIGFR